MTLVRGPACSGFQCLLESASLLPGLWFDALCRAFFEVSLHDGPEGYFGLRARLGLLKLRIVAEVRRGERALRPLACFVGVEASRQSRASRAVASSRRDIGRSTFACHHLASAARSGQGSVKGDPVLHASGKRQRFDIRLEASALPLGSTWEASFVIASNCFFKHSGVTCGSPTPNIWHAARSFWRSSR